MHGRSAVPAVTSPCSSDVAVAVLRLLAASLRLIPNWRSSTRPYSGLPPVTDAMWSTLAASRVVVATAGSAGGISGAGTWAGSA